MAEAIREIGRRVILDRLGRMIPTALRDAPANGGTDAGEHHSQLTSRKWLREATSGRVKNLINSLNFVPSIIEREVAGEKHKFYIGNVTARAGIITIQMSPLR